ncbi:MAG: T9SS type A sorting domain-containing protein [Bacteroidetes bacterium]|nr:MAG: T9SS type A sorting domain-containing protein [Bacteroidota bacterium]
MKKSTTIFFFVLIANLSLAQLSWIRLSDFPGCGKPGVAAVSLNGKGYMGLGLGTNGMGCTDWYEYNSATNAWTQKASFPSTGRWSTASFVIGNKAYVCTGAKDVGLSNETWEYDPNTDAWTQKANVPGPVRQNAVAFAIDNIGYVGTGYSANTTYDDFYQYDPTTDMWTAIANFPGPTRSGATAFTIGSMGYVGMGNNTNSTSNFQDFYEYNPQTDAWTQKTDFPLPYVVAPTAYSGSADCYSLCGYYYQYSGITHNPLNMLYKYNQASDLWTLSGTFSGLPRGYAGGFALSNDIYIGGGGQKNDGSAASMLTDFWKLSNGLTLRVENPDTYSDFKIIPNPSTHSISFDNSLHGKEFESMRIFDVSGKFVVEKSISRVDKSFDISFLSNGIYFVELVTVRGEVLDSRFVKE